MTSTISSTAASPGSLIELGDTSWYRIDRVERMDPFLVSVAGNSDLWLFASSAGTLTLGRTDADHALLPYETDDRLHRLAGVTGPVTVISRGTGTERQTWRPFAADADPSARRALAKSTVGNQIFLEETHTDWGLTFRTTWSPSPAYGWVRTVELIDESGANHQVRVLDGLVGVMPFGIEAGFQESKSNLADAYRRSETGRWGSAALYTIEARITDTAQPAESLAATVVWSYGDAPTELLLDERSIRAEIEDRPWPSSDIVYGRRGSYLRRGDVEVPANGTVSWSLVGDTGLDHAAVLDRIAMAQHPKAADAVDSDISSSVEGLERLLAVADGFQSTGDAVADAHHLSNVMSNAMRGGLLPFGMSLPIRGFLDHLETWNRPVFERYAEELGGMGAEATLADLHGWARRTGDGDLERLVLEYFPLAFSRRHGDPSRPWNRFSIRVRDEAGNEVLGYQGNWRDIFQNWEALLLSHPGFASHAVAKFVNASTLDGHNPYRITQDGVDWEVPDPHDPWSHIGYWGDHQIVYLHRLLSVWDRFDPGDINTWLDRKVFVYADVPYALAGHQAMVADPRETITYDWDRAGRVDARVAALGADGRLLVDPAGEIVRVSLMEKLLVPALGKLTALVPGGGIWMNTQRPEWNDANNALAGYGLSMVTLYYLNSYLHTLRGLIERHDTPTVLSGTVAQWLSDLSAALGAADPKASAADDTARRALLDRLGAAGEAYRAAAWAGFDTTDHEVAPADLIGFLDTALAHLQASIAVAKRRDGLYDAYNVISFPDEATASVSHLGPMLEGQVSALSSGALGPAEVLEVVDALFESGMYRADQDTFMLYPVRTLPRFVDKNIVRNGALNGLVERLAEVGVVVVDDNGGVHFTPDMLNASDLGHALEEAGFDASEQATVQDAYEATFNHHSYTGRSGSFYGYEGIGSIFWHMVGKLLVAVQETCITAREVSDPVTCSRLAETYLKVRDGLGFRKDPGTYGAIPTDCYSHSPSHSGAQQPWMTGSVKEGVIARFGEIGLRVEEGTLSLASPLIPLDDLFDEDGVATFSYCGVPVTIHKGAADTVALKRGGSWSSPAQGTRLDATTSREIFDRTGTIDAVRFTLGGAHH